MQYRFEEVDSSLDHVQLLFGLLKVRKHVISHSKIPSFKNHEAFVKNHPYKCWYLIFELDVCVGSFYIKRDNSMGLNVTVTDPGMLRACLEFVSTNFTPEPEQPSEVPPYFYINVPISHSELITSLESAGLSPIQVSMRMHQ